MEQTYLIAWKCQTNGRIGRSTNPLTLKQAQRLAAQLNQEHPDFEHVPVPQTMENFSGVFAALPKNVLILQDLLETNSPSAAAHQDTDGELLPAEEYVLTDEESEEAELDALKEA